MTSSKQITANQENGKLGGRPKGTPDKPKITDSMSEEDIQLLIGYARERAKDSDVMLKFLLEQYWGRAKQAVFTEDEDGKVIPIQGINYTVPNVSD